MSSGRSASPTDLESDISCSGIQLEWLRQFQVRRSEAAIEHVSFGCKLSSTIRFEMGHRVYGAAQERELETVVLPILS